MPVFLAPLIIGFIAGAEFASLALVHPVVRRLEAGDRPGTHRPFTKSPSLPVERR